jgi:poly(ADP-ribose) glycohydrolase ARH3
MTSRQQIRAACTTIQPMVDSPRRVDTLTIERFRGCLLGLALGDALGAVHEGGPLERLVWRVIGTTSAGHIRWTDDTQMSLDVAESLIAAGALNLEDLALRFAGSYRWSRGYGPSTSRVLRRLARGMHWAEANRSVHRDGSFGNGGAMRAPVIGLFYAERVEDLAAAARLSASVTHAHPLAMEGAALVASATALALSSHPPAKVLQAAALACTLEPFVARLEIATKWFNSGAEPGPAEVAGQLGNGVAAGESCVTAVYVAMRFLGRSFLELQEFIAECRGDVDTIGAMAGAIWGAANGVTNLPPQELERLEQRERLMNIASALHARMIEVNPVGELPL